MDYLDPLNAIANVLKSILVATEVVLVYEILLEFFFLLFLTAVVDDYLV